MSVPRYKSPKLQLIKVESLRLQSELLKILRFRHLHWSTSTDDPEIQKQHQEIADLIEEMGAQYSHLLESLQGSHAAESNDEAEG